MDEAWLDAVLFIHSGGACARSGSGSTDLVCSVRGSWEVAAWWGVCSVENLVAAVSWW